MPSLSFDFAAIRRAFAVRNFAIYTAGNSISLIGMWVQRLAVGWLVWDLTHSGLWLGTLAVAEFLPTVAITPLGGVISDRIDRRLVSYVTQSMTAALAVALWALTVGEWITAELVVALVFSGSVLGAVNQASRVALVPNLVPRSAVGTAIALNAVIFNMARFVGPAVAGVIIARAGIGWAFLVNAVSYLPLLYALSRLDLPARPVRPGPVPHVFADLTEGLRYTFRHSAIATVITLIAVGSVLTRAIIELLPGFAAEVFQGGASMLAAFTSAGGAGAIAAGLWLAQRSSVRGLSAIVLGTVLLNGAAVALFAFTGDFVLAMAMMALSGFCNVASGTGSQTLIQTTVEDHMRGRVMSVWLLVNRAGPALGAMIFGALSERFGFGWPTVIGSAGTMIAAAWVMRHRALLAAALEKGDHAAPDSMRGIQEA